MNLMRDEWLPGVGSLVLGTNGTSGNGFFDVMSHTRPIHNGTSSGFTLLHAQVTFMQFSQHFTTHTGGNNELVSPLNNRPSMT